MLKADKDKSKILSKNLFPVVGIGASAGGLEAFKNLIKAIPENSGMAYILVQHLHPEHESALPEILQRVTNIPVVEISDNVHVDPNHIYVIPSNKTLVATDGVLKLSPRSGKDQRNMPIDVFFSSLAEVHQAHSIGVVLSGTGSDGTAGLKDIKVHGGFTFAQDVASATYDGMPQHAIDAEVVDFVLPPDKIPARLMELQQSFIISPDDKLTPKNKTDEDGFRQILALLRVRAGVDFSYYKQTTVRRRIIRRMVILHLETITDYLDYLKKNKPELDILFQDLLIPVTSFFRDTITFESLCETVFPEIIKNLLTVQAGRSASNPLRLWVAGCSTGQEAYSIAMCIHEYLSDHVSNLKIQIFATDISEKSIKKARSGIYLKKELDAISENRLNQFFNKADGNYQVKKPVRDMCVFAVHNFLKDPPFAKIDFISCRNVLIYFEPFLQKKALTIFHYALNDKGVLWLGKSETTGSASDLFIPFGKKDKFYTRKAVPGRYMNVASERSETAFTDKNYFLRSKEGKTNDFQKNADDILLSKYTHAGVIINDQFDIVQFRGSTREYMEPSPGKASLNVLKMAKEGLAFEIRNALHKAKTTGEAYTKEDIPINNGKKVVTIEVIPLLNTVDLHYLILFREQSTVDSKKLAVNNQQLAVGNRRLAKNIKDEKDIRIKQLEKELAQVREDMHSITEDQEAANEELQSSNEELLSGSEELQSLNEELETSKEELQSTNEELITVNHELYDSNEQLNQSREFAEATLSTLHEPLLVLDKNFRIKRANKSFYKNFKLTEDDTLGRILFELQDGSWDTPGLRKELEKVQKENEKMIEAEITFRFPSLGERIICSNIQPIQNENAEQMILLTLEDITARKDAEKIKEDSNAVFRMLADAMPQKVWTADLNGNVNYFNQKWLEYTHKSFEELKGWGWKKIIHPADWNANEKAWQHSIDTGEDFDIEHRFLCYDETYRWHLSRGLPHKDEKGNILMWIGTNTDIHDQKVLAEEKVLIEFAEDFESYQSGAEFFNSLAIYIAKKTGMDYTFIGELTENEKGSSTIKTIALTAQGKIVPNIEYPLPDGPCEQLINGTVYSYPQQCKTIFPKNETIAQFNAEGYVGYPLLDTTGKAIGLIAVMHEKEISNHEYISALLKVIAKRAEFEIERIKFSEARARAFMQSNVIGVNVSLIADGTVVEANDAFLNMIGYSHDDLKKGKINWIHSTPEKYMDRDREAIDIAMRKNVSPTYEKEIICKDGRKIFVLIGMALVNRDKGEMMNIFIDITERKRLEQSKDDFISIASHEMKTPLTTAKAYLQLLEITILPTNEPALLYAKRASQSVTRLNELIGELLDVSKIQNGKLNYNITTFNFNEMIDNTVEDIQHSSPNHTITKTGKVSEEVTGDKDRLQQVVINLLSNAIKYSPEAGKIFVHVEQNDAEIKVSVKDNGIGISKHNLEKIFDKYYRIEGNAINFQGLGIGLFISYEIIQRHKGKLWVESEVGKGSTFYFTLPAPSQPPPG